MKKYGIQDFKKSMPKQECVFGWSYLVMCRDFKTLHTWLESQAYPSCLWRFGGHWKNIKKLFCGVYCNNTSEYHIRNFPALKKTAQHIKRVENIINAIIFITKNRNEKINVLSHEIQGLSYR